MQLEQKPKAVKVLYYFVMVLSVFATCYLAFNPLVDYLNKTVDFEYLGYIFAGVPTIIAALVGIKLKNKVRAWRLFLLLIISLAILVTLILLGTKTKV